MTLQEAINDPNRPLNVSPKDWMQQIEQSQKLAEETIIYPEEAEQTISEDNAFGTIDVGMDYIIQGIQTVMKGLQIANKIDLNIEDRAIIKFVDENIRGGVLPYAIDIVEKLSEMLNFADVGFCDGCFTGKYPADITHETFKGKERGGMNFDKDKKENCQGSDK